VVVLALLVIAVALAADAPSSSTGSVPALFFAYEAMRGYAGQTGFAHKNDLSGSERAVFCGDVATITLQHAFYRPDNVSVAGHRRDVLLLHALPLPIVRRVFFLGPQPRPLRAFIAALC